jgi:hypothetical protein
VSRPEHRAQHGRLVITLAFVVGLIAMGAVAEPAAAAVSEPSALCLPILMTCSPPSPTPAPSRGPSGGAGVGSIGGVVGGTVNGLGRASSGPPAAGGSTAPLVIGPDTGAPIFTTPAGQLGGTSITFSGLRQIGLVTVRRIDGSTFPVIKLQADDIVITGFSLDVRRASGPSLVSTADRMELAGHVSVWVDSFTASLLGGGGLTIGTNQTPPPGAELPARFLRVTLGLVGTTADSITYSHLHQALHE